VLTVNGPAGAMAEDRGATVWLTGLPSAGKSSVAYAAEKLLRGSGRRVEVLDGDEIRAELWPDLGFTRADRDLNIRRIGFIAELLASNGVLVLVAAIAPLADSRATVRERHRVRGTDFLEVYVATPVEVCALRDVKGLYARRAAGTISGLTGVDAAYEAPTHPDLRLETTDRTVAESADEVCRLLSEHGLL